MKIDQTNHRVVAFVEEILIFSSNEKKRRDANVAEFVPGCGGNRTDEASRSSVRASGGTGAPGTTVRACPAHVHEVYEASKAGGRASRPCPAPIAGSVRANGY